jgi:two-component system LytT family response regulator
VFCTAYDQFAIKAFKYSALNYLLKPVDPDDLKETVRRLEEKKSSPSRSKLICFYKIYSTLASPPHNALL